MSSALFANAIEGNVHLSLRRATVVLHPLPVGLLHWYVGDAFAAAAEEVCVGREIGLENQRMHPYAQRLYHSGIAEQPQGVVDCGTRYHRHLLMQILKDFFCRGVVAMFHQVCQHRQPLMRRAYAELMQNIEC